MLKEAVQQHLAKAAPVQMTSSISDWEPRSPEKKGRVESAVGYAKHSFFDGRDGNDAHETAQQLERWVDTIANVRSHGTTRRRPNDMLELEERAALLPVPERP